MDGTQTVDYDALAKQNGAISAPSTQIDYDALAKQHGATSSTPAARPTADPNAATISAAPPMNWWQQLRADFPIIDKAEYGLQTAFANPSTTPKQQALAKLPEAVSDPRAVRPELGLSSEERQAHPMITGAAEFAGGMTTPENMLLTGLSGGLGKFPGVAGRVIPRVASGIFSAQMLRGVYDEVPDFRAALQRGNASEAERIFTHIVLGTTMAGLGIHHAATGEPTSTAEGPVGNSVYESYRRAGEFFSKLKQKSNTLNSISEAATGLYNSIRQDLMTHQEALRADGAKTIQGAIDADKAALMNTNRGSIPTAKTVAEAAKLLAATGYEMKPAERGLFSRIENQPELTLEQAKQLRTAVGRVAFGRSSVTPEAKAVFTAAYNELGQGMKGRITELQGTGRPYEHYNNQMKASFELEDGIAGEMLESLRGQDRHAAMPKMEKFSDANLDELQEQMRKIGLTRQANTLAKSQEHARVLVGAHDVANGKYMSGVYRLFMQSPKQAWPGLAVMAAAHGMRLPFPGPQIAGAIVASGHISRQASAAAGRVSQELKATLPPEYFRTRTPAEAPENFTYLDPDAPYNPPPKSPAPTNPKGRYSQSSDAELEARGKASMERRKANQDVAVERRQPSPEGMDLLAQRAMQESMGGKGNTQGIDTDAYTKAMVQARKEIGPGDDKETRIRVIKRRDEILGTKGRPSGDIGSQMRAKNPEPTRAEVKAAQLKRVKGRR